MNPHAAPSISPGTLIKSVRINSRLIFNLAHREVIGRYRGSILGVLWSFFNPVLMLAVYTFVFSVVFKARWPGGSDSKTEFAVVLFAGLLVFNFFSECINRAPSLVLENVNYVKKVIFPLEILPVVTLSVAIFHFSVGFVVWLGFYLMFFGVPHLTLMYLPLVLLPLVFLMLGIAWFLASLSVYLRDISQVVGVATTVLMFMSPIFFPVAALPEEYRAIVQANPLTLVVEDVRSVMIWGNGIDWIEWSKSLFGALIVFWLGFAWFQKTRRGFADVL